MNEPHSISGEDCRKQYPDCVGCPYIIRGCPDSVGPVMAWAKACEQANRAVEMMNFEQQADMAIDEAERLLALARTLKGIACTVCGGYGRRSYPNTTTWRGGFGGQAFTNDVCDSCWGTGRTDITGPNERKMLEYLRKNEHEIKQLQGEVQFLRERLQYDPGGSDKIDELEDAAMYLREDIARLQEVLRLCAAEPCTWRSDVDCAYRWSEKEKGKWCAPCRARAALGLSKK